MGPRAQTRLNRKCTQPNARSQNCFFPNCFLSGQKKTSDKKRILGLALGCVHFLFKRVCGRGPIPGVPFYIGPDPRTKNNSGDSHFQPDLLWNSMQFLLKFGQIGSDPVRSAWMGPDGPNLFLYAGFGRFPELRFLE